MHNLPHEDPMNQSSVASRLRLEELREEMKQLEASLKKLPPPGVLGASVLAFLLLPVFVAFQGLCLMVMWNWFAPAPFGRVDFVHACGLDALFGLVLVFCSSPNKQGAKAEAETAGDVWRSVLVRQLILPAFMLAVGAMIHAIGGLP